MRISICILSVIVMFGCGTPVSKIRVLGYPGEPWGNAYDTMAIRRVRASYSSDSIVVRLKDRRKLVLASISVWGYQDIDSNLWRYSGGRFIQVRQLDTPSIYSVHHSVGRSSYTHYSFSQTPSAPVYSFKWKYIKREYADDTCFLRRLNGLGFFQAYESYDHKRKQYRFVQLYKGCRIGTVP